MDNITGLPFDTIFREAKSQKERIVFEVMKMLWQRLPELINDDADFQLDNGWEEDNHVPYGIARNFWRPLAENLVGIECKCKEEEPAIVEDKGDYVWRYENP